MCTLGVLGMSCEAPDHQPPTWGCVCCVVLCCGVVGVVVVVGLEDPLLDHPPQDPLSPSPLQPPPPGPNLWDQSSFLPLSKKKQIRSKMCGPIQSVKVSITSTHAAIRLLSIRLFASSSRHQSACRLILSSLSRLFNAVRCL